MKKLQKAVFTSVAFLSMVMTCTLGNVTASESVAIDATHFPGEILREAVKQYDQNADGILSPEEAQSIEQITIMDGEYDDELDDASIYPNYVSPVYVESDQVVDLEGVQYLTNLKKFKIDPYFGLTGGNWKKFTIQNFAKLSQCKSLQEIYLGRCELETVDFSVWPQLQKIIVESSSKLTSVKVSNENLTEFHLQRVAGLKTLDLSGAANLKKVEVRAENLKSIQVAACKKLTTLTVQSNKLQSVNVKKNEKLADVWLGGKNMNAPDFTKNKKLKKVIIGGVKLKTLDMNKAFGAKTKVKELRIEASEIENFNPGKNVEKLEVSESKVKNATFEGALKEVTLYAVKNLSKADFSNCRNVKTLTISERAIKNVNVRNNTTLKHVEFLQFNLSKIKQIKVGNEKKFKKVCSQYKKLKKSGVKIVK